MFPSAAWRPNSRGRRRVLKADDHRFRSALRKVGPGFASVLRRLPPREDDYLPANWLQWEMLERYEVLSHAGVEKGTEVLEIGAGAHAIATVPLAFFVGSEGRVMAVERERWTFFREIVEAAGLGGRVLPVMCDAARLPIPSETFDFAVCVHGVRSLRSEKTMLAVFQEMLRVAPRLLLVESLPIARNEAQRAHLAMYDLREEIFEAVLGHKDDLHYLSLGQLVALVEQAGGTAVESEVLDVDFPHFLAFLPRQYVERINDDEKRDNLLRRWDKANQLLERHGADHPPVGILAATKTQD